MGCNLSTRKKNNLEGQLTGLSIFESLPNEVDLQNFKFLCSYLKKNEHYDFTLFGRPAAGRPPAVSHYLSKELTD